MSDLHSKKILLDRRYKESVSILEAQPGQEF